MRRAILLLFLAGCLPGAYRQARLLEGRYVLGAPGTGWDRVDPGGADHAWYSRGLAATIYADSNCGPRYTESIVENLATELLAGVRDVVTQRDEPMQLGGREGVLRVHAGRLDGVPITLAFGVVNKGACTYDFTYISPPGNFDAGWGAYAAVLDGFRTR